MNTSRDLVNKQIVIDSSHQIDGEKVKSNRTVKLEGTFGETIVVFHEAVSPLGQLIRAIQKHIITILGEVSQDRAVNDFASANGDMATPTSFAPIQNPHTTIIAMHVIDALDASSWRKKTIASHIYTEAEERSIVARMQADPVVHLEMEAVVLCPNGVLGIKWRLHEGLIALRRELSKNGGIAKHGDETITTTIGYFPDCNEAVREKIANVLEFVCTERNLLPVTQQQLYAGLTFAVNLTEAKFVKFARNDLDPEFVVMSDLLLSNHLCLDFYNSEFPIELIRKKECAVEHEMRRHLQQHHHIAEQNKFFTQSVASGSSSTVIQRAVEFRKQS